METACQTNTSSRHLTACFGASLLLVVLSGCGGSSTTAGNDSNEITAPTVSAASFNYSPKSIVLSWNIPTTRADGTPLSAVELGGYEIVYLTSTSNQIQNVTVNNPLATSYTLNNLSPNSYRFLIFSYDSDNRVSQASAEVILPLSSFANL